MLSPIVIGACRSQVLRLGVLLSTLGCQRPAESTEPLEKSTTSVVAAVTSAAADVAPSNAATTSATVPGIELGIDARIVGVWHGTGVVSAVRLDLPGNQGVQLAWVKDKGTEFVGPIDVKLEITPSGSLGGAATGSLGNLSVGGNWDGHGHAHATLDAKARAPEAFSGTLSVQFSEPMTSASASLRVVSNDGRWVRQAVVPLVLTK